MKIDVPQRHRWSEGSMQCEGCSENITWPLQDQPEAMLCLRAICPTFRGHIIAMGVNRNHDNLSDGFKSSAGFYVIWEPIGKMASITNVDGVSIRTYAPGTTDVHNKWRISVDSLREMAQHDKRSEPRHIEMCDRSKWLEKCEQCALRQQSNRDMAYSW
jgi:hypothetical protein